MGSKVYRVVLELKSPAYTFKSFLQEKTVREIHSVIKRFNENFSREKLLKIEEIRDQQVCLYLAIIKPDKDKIYSARDISFISRRLVNDYGWEQYSREESVLFSAITFEETKMTLEEFNSIVSNVYFDFFERDLDDYLMTDEEAVEVFKALIAVQNFGSKTVINKRKRAILEIKINLREIFS